MKKKSKKSSKPNAAKQTAKLKGSAFGPDRTSSGKIKGTKMLGQSRDPTFGWVRTVCRREGDAETPLEQWRALGEKYMAHLSANGEGAYAKTLHSLRMFFEHYLWKYAIYTPEALFTVPRGATMPDLRAPKGSGAPYRDGSSHGGVVAVNYLHDFLTWVIKTEYSTDEDGQLVPFDGFRVPFDRLSYDGVGQPNETVRLVLPYAYMCELRDLLAPGTDFRDWTWAHGATGTQAGAMSGDWFEVDKSLIDLNDPDCVWHGPDTITIRNYQLPEHERRMDFAPDTIVGTREVYYMWSPVTAVALLTKLEMPWRTFQVRMLDSGETDATCVELDPEGEQAFLNAQHGKTHERADGIDPDTDKTSLVQKNLFRWVENPQREALLNGLTRDERGRVRNAQGVFLQCDEGRVGKFVGFFINTNKTADADKAWHLRGYRIHYQHSSLHRWLVKLRNWQRTYNPIQRPTLWTELEAKHTGGKSDFDLRAAAPTCFLFRDASARDKRAGDETKPMTDNQIDNLWSKLLTTLEDKKAAAGETDADGNPVRFIKTRRKSIGSSTSFYSLHALRGSWISALADAGMALKLLMKLAGHTRLVMTIYYRKINAWQMAEGMRKSQENLAKRGDEHTLRVLKGNAYEQMPKYIVADQESLEMAVPRNPNDRTSSGWLRLLGGWCLMGGNTHPSADRTKCGGCFNGGSLIVAGKHKCHREYAAVKPRACIECKCRWFVTRPEYLLEIRSKMMLLADRLHAVQRQLSQYESELHDLKIGRARHAKSHPDQPFPQLAELRRLESLVEKLSADSQTLSIGIGHAANLADRVIAVELLDESNGEKTQLIAQGSNADVRWAFEAASSDLLALADICANAEIYPELEPESESAVRTMGQVLDVSLQQQGMGLVFARLTPEQQLRLGNRFIREVARPLHDNLAAAVAMIERGKVPHSAEILRRLIEEGKYAPTPVAALLNSAPATLSPSPLPQQPAA